MIKLKMLKFFSKIKITNKLKSYFKNKFKNTNNELFRSEILLEFNAFQSYHVPVAYFANFLKKKYKSNIVGFFNYKILSSPFEESLYNKIKWIIGDKFNLKNFSIFRSFGVKKIIKPSLNKEEYKISYQIFINLKKTLSSKRDVLNISINDIRVGDLIYDTYIKSKIKPTIFFDDDFYFLLHDFCKLFVYWKKYFENNDIKAVIGVHTAYSYGIPLRIALKKKIPTYCVSFRKINKLSENMRYLAGEFVNYKKNFLKLDINLKRKGIEKAKKRLEDRINGVAGVKADIISSQISSFGKKYLNREINENNKIKVVIFPHDFFDAVHAYGDTLFEDFYEWLEYLGKISKKTDYDWYIKNRPNYLGKFQIYQPNTENIINKFVSNYPQIKKLPNNYPHNQIISEGISCVLTAFGSVAMEYALFNIPVINASKNNPHCNYNFNFHPKNLKEYEKLILDIKNIKLKIEKTEIYEYYFMRHIYNSKNWLIDDLEDFMKFVGSWTHMNSYKFYEYWIKNISEDREKKLNVTIENFINSNDDATNISHTLEK